MKNESVAKELVKIARRLVEGKYQDIGHFARSKIWWLDAGGKFKFVLSTGSETHHNLDKKLNMDKTWRGRIDPKGVASILPPVELYAKPFDIPVPDSLMSQLEKAGAKVFFMDTQYGLRRVAVKKRKGE